MLGLAEPARPDRRLHLLLRELPNDGRVAGERALGVPGYALRLPELPGLLLRLVRRGLRAGCELLAIVAVRTGRHAAVRRRPRPRRRPMHGRRGLRCARSLLRRQLRMHRCVCLVRDRVPRLGRGSFQLRPMWEQLCYRPDLLQWRLHDPALTCGGGAAGSALVAERAATRGFRLSETCAFPAECC